jgi:hypothetical protein
VSRTYPYGYKGGTKTEPDYLTWNVWLNFDPEYRRRVKAAMDHAADNGRAVGVGGGYRSTIGQLGLFLARHHAVASGGCCEYNGQRYALNAGAAHAAPPGRSYHEATTPDGLCLAADMVGDLAWINPQLATFGLKHFGGINGEPWHWQVVELPNSRSSYDPAKHHPLPVWSLPGEIPPPPPTPDPIPTEDDMLDLDPHARVYDTRALAAPFTAGEVRAIPVSFGGSAALIRLQAIATTNQGGYLHVYATNPASPETAEVNFGPMASGSDLCRTKLAAGVVKVKASAPCHLIIDTQAVTA